MPRDVLSPFYAVLFEYRLAGQITVMLTDRPQQQQQQQRCVLCDDVATLQNSNMWFCSQACVFMRPRFDATTGGTFTKLDARWSPLLKPKLPESVQQDRTSLWRYWDQLDVAVYGEYEQLLATEQAEPTALAAIRDRITAALTKPGATRQEAWKLTKDQDRPLEQAFNERHALCTEWLAECVAQNAEFARTERRWRLEATLRRTDAELIDAPPSLARFWGTGSAHWGFLDWLKRKYSTGDDALAKLERTVTPKRTTYLATPVAALQALRNQMPQKALDDDEYYCRVKYAQLMLYAYERVYLALFQGRHMKLDGKKLARIDAKLIEIYEALVTTSLAALRGQEVAALSIYLTQSISQTLKPLFDADKTVTKSAASDGGNGGKGDKSEKSGKGDKSGESGKSGKSGKNRSGRTLEIDDDDDGDSDESVPRKQKASDDTGTTVSFLRSQEINYATKLTPQQLMLIAQMIRFYEDEAATPKQKKEKKERRRKSKSKSRKDSGSGDEETSGKKDKKEKKDKKDKKDKGKSKRTRSEETRSTEKSTKKKKKSKQSNDNNNNNNNNNNNGPRSIGARHLRLNLRCATRTS